MSPADLDAMMEGVTALLENVTPGPWRLGSWGDNVFGTGPNDEWLLICRIKRDDAPVNESRDGADARFIAASRELVPALAAEVVTLRRDRDMLRQNMRDTYEAMVSMRNSINEFIPMPSLESDLLQGPENSVFCATVAEAVVAYVQANRATIAGLEARVDALAGAGRAIVEHDAFDPQYLSADLNAKLGALRAALSGDTPNAAV